ncbi:hypothetical protein [Rhizobium leguminosarum]|uniref:hypothetical protein n=1 Tax=Rhizobium leguminosarum TaxID=384 RepID=UPI0013EEB036|nr:hypothetical protein [Rhizobium leguminosarum]
MIEVEPSPSAPAADVADRIRGETSVYHNTRSSDAMGFAIGLRQARKLVNLA